MNASLNTSRRALLCSALASTALISLGAQAQTFPDKSMKIFVGAPAGGSARTATSLALPSMSGCSAILARRSASANTTFGALSLRP